MYPRSFWNVVNCGKVKLFYAEVDPDLKQNFNSDFNAVCVCVCRENAWSSWIWQLSNANESHLKTSVRFQIDFDKLDTL